MAGLVSVLVSTLAVALAVCLVPVLVPALAVGLASVRAMSPTGSGSCWRSLVMSPIGGVLVSPLAFP